MGIKSNEIDLSSERRPRAFRTWISERVRQRAHELLEVPTEPFLDVGCGDGLFLIEKFKLLGIFRIFGLDYDLSALMEGQKILQDNSIQFHPFIRGNAYVMPFRDETFQTVVCLNTFMNLDPFNKIQWIFREMFRVCQDGGTILFEFRNASNPFIKYSYRKKVNSGELRVFAHSKREFTELLKQYPVREVNFYPVIRYLTLFLSPSILVKIRR